MSFTRKEIRNLGLLWIGQFVSRAGDYAFNSVLVFLILSIETEQAKAKSGTVWLFHTIPFLLFGVFAGMLADRYNRRRLMIASDMLRAGLACIIPLAYWYGRLDWLVIGAAMFLMSLSSTVFTPARDAMIPELVGKGRSLLRVNALFQTSEQIAMIVGTALAGLYLGFSEAEGDPNRVQEMVGLVLLDGLTYVVSFLTILGIRYTPAPRSERSSPSWQDLKAALRFAFKDPMIRPLLWITALNNLMIMGPAIVGATFFIKERLLLGPRHVAYYILAFGVGWLLGTIAILRWGPRLPKGKMLCFGLLMDGASFLPLYFVHSFDLLLVLVAFHAVWVSLVTVGRTTLIHEYVPRAMHGKIFSLVNLTVVGFIGFSCWATGVAGEYVEPGILFLAAGVTGSACGLAALAIRSLRGAR